MILQQDDNRVGRCGQLLFANAGVGELVPLGAVQKALPLFHDGGSIILNASIAASKGFEASSVYSTTNHTVVHILLLVDLKGEEESDY